MLQGWADQVHCLEPLCPQEGNDHNYGRTDRLEKVNLNRRKRSGVLWVGVRSEKDQDYLPSD